MVAEVLGLAMDDIHIEMEDSHDAVLDSGMFGDRCTVWSGNAVVAAAEDAKKQLAEIAPKASAWIRTASFFSDKKVFVKDSPDKQIPFLRLVRQAQYSLGRCIYGTVHGPRPARPSPISPSVTPNTTLLLSALSPRPSSWMSTLIPGK